MRILIVTSFSPTLISMRKDLIIGIKKKCKEAYIIAPDFSLYPKVKNQLKSLGFVLIEIPLVRQGITPFKDLNYFFKLTKTIFSLNIDLLFTYSIKTILYSGWAIWLVNFFRGNKIKFFPMLTGLGYLFTNKEEKPFLGNFISFTSSKLINLSLRNSHYLILQNVDDLSLLKKKKIINDEIKTSIVNGSGVDIIKFAKKPLPRENSFLMIARLNKDKGVIEYLNAAKKIKNLLPEVEFRLIGIFDNHPRAIDKKIIDEFKDFVNFLGEVPNNKVKKELEKCRFYVLPSYREGVPKSTLEALAVARPIITTNVAGCRETVNNGENGYLVPLKNSKVLSQYMLKLINTPHPCLVNMANKSRQLAINKFDMRLINKNIIKLLFDEDL